jgi:rhodanese-related sulfurtransferase
VIVSLTPPQAHQLISTGEIDVVDVRDLREWSTGRLPGSRHVPLDRLRSTVRTSLPRDGVMFVCAAGVRSHTAAKLAEAHGLSRLYSLSGGTRAWANAGLPLVRDELEALTRAV